MVSEDATQNRRWLVSGRVQGVFFRASTRDVARRLGLDGSARNLDDGRVEVVASGDPRELDRLADWLHAGPPGARVDRVEEVPCQETPAAGFLTL